MKNVLRHVLMTMMVLGVSVSGSWAASEALAPFADQKGTINIAGGTAHIPVMKKAAQAIMTFNKQIRIAVAGGGSGVGVKKVGEGLVDIGNTGRALKESEITKYGLQSFPFAIDGVAIAVHPSNPVTAITKEQAIQIFTGKITRWSALGGKDAPITVYVREDGSGTRETFEEKALDKATSFAKANVLGSNGAMKTAIAQDPNALGYVGIGHVDASIKGLHFENIAPTQDNAAQGSYAITRRLYMNTKGAPEGLTKLFVNYIFSQDGATFITEAGYIPVPQAR